jgi:hypothetical protein
MCGGYVPSVAQPGVLPASVEVAGARICRKATLERAQEWVDMEGASSQLSKV